MMLRVHDTVHFCA